MRAGEIQTLQKATAKDFIYNGSFQEAVAPVLLAAECFAIMPVIGIRSGSASKMYFTWRSVRTIYSIIVFVLMTILAALTIVVTFRQNIEFDSIGEWRIARFISLSARFESEQTFLMCFISVPVIFYSSVVYSMICFGYLATKWPALMAQWEQVEQRLPVLRSFKERGRLAYRVRMITIIVMTLSLGTHSIIIVNNLKWHLVISLSANFFAATAEHILSIVSVVHYANNCQNKSDNPIEEYFLSSLRPIFTFTSYAPWKAFIGQMLASTAALMWTYMNVFLMIVSVGLSTRFKQINKNIMEHKGEVLTISQILLPI